MKVLVYVQNVLGVGHVMRMLKICKDFTDADITFVTGGDTLELILPPHIKHVRLPGIMTDETFTKLRTVDESVSLERTWKQRSQILSGLMCSENFDLIITEMFPFGRRQFRRELEPLLKLNKLKRNRAKVVCSLRDILFLESLDDAASQRILDIVNTYYDAIFIHADARMDQVSPYFSYMKHVHCPVYHTGYITDVAREVVCAESPTILASIGGGAVGHEFLEKAIEASKILNDSFDHTFCVYCGVYAPEYFLNACRDTCEYYPHIQVHRYTSQFFERLCKSTLSVNMGGYNTIMEIICSGIPSIVYPFEQNREQAKRLDFFQESGQFTVLDHRAVDAEELAQLMEQRCRDYTRHVTDLDTNGIQTSITKLKTLLEG